MKVALWLVALALTIVGLQGCKHERRYIEPVEQRRVNVELKGEQKQQNNRQDTQPQSRRKNRRRSERSVRY